jgi:tRNA G18 (ribose-2'-O)-methylase SpoU
MGYCAIGIENFKKDQNIGTLWRSAHIFGAAYLFTIGRPYKLQASDTTKAYRHIPLVEFKSLEDFYDHLPREASLVGVENSADAIPVVRFVHPKQAVYLLGSEDNGLSERALELCKVKVVLPGEYCLNVAVAGSLILFDRYQKEV